MEANLLSSLTTSKTENKVRNYFGRLYTFTCGANLQELELPNEMSEISVRDVPFYDPLEKLYYSMKIYMYILLCL